jgi:hypothetical protein
MTYLTWHRQPGVGWYATDAAGTTMVYAYQYKGAWKATGLGLGTGRDLRDIKAAAERAMAARASAE